MKIKDFVLFFLKNREGFYFVTNMSHTKLPNCTHSHTTIKINSKQTMKEENIHQLRQSKIGHIFEQKSKTVAYFSTKL